MMKITPYLSSSVKLHSQKTFTLRVLLLSLFASITSFASSSETVYYQEGGVEVHVENCVRYQRLAPEVQSSMTKMTAETAESKGLFKCSRCISGPVVAEVL